MLSIIRLAVDAVRRRVSGFVGYIVRSFQAKLIVLVLMSVLVPSGVIWIFTVQDTERFQTAQTKEKFGSVLGAAKKDIAYWYKDRLGDLSSLVQSNGFLRPLGAYLSESDAATRAYQQNEIRKYFTFVREKFPLYETFVVLDDEGQSIASSEGIDSHVVTYLDSLRIASSKQRYISGARLSDDRDRVYQWVLIPVETAQSNAITVCVQVSLESLGTILGPDRYDSVGDLYIVDAQGMLLTQPRVAPYDATNNVAINMIGERAIDVPVRDRGIGESPVVEKYVKEMLTSDGRRYRRTTFLGSKTHLSQHDWWLVCESEESRFIAPVVARKNRIWAANMVICALFVLIAWRMSRYLLRPLNALSIGAKRINEGMVGVEIPKAHEDEVGHMVDAFNDMAKRIAVTEVKLQATNKQLQGKNQELTSMNDRLEQLSVTDGLTGLFNHRHFWNLMNSELTRANLYDGELGLVLLDIDNFKQVNDQFGHATGDLLIQQISQIIKDTVRSTDLVARYGGEEFAVLLPDTSRDGVLGVSEKVRAAVESMVFKVPETDITLGVTVSVGVSVFRGNRREFFNAADRALYTSKKEGKNCVNFEVAAS